MTILIDAFIGDEETVFEDLVQIVRCDPGLASAPSTQFVHEVTYQQKQQAVLSSTRILQLVRVPQVILITGVGPLFVPPGDTIPLISSGGGVCLDATLTAPITVWVDVTDAAGQGYFSRGMDGRTINQPREVTLYHELAHAYHKITGDEPEGWEGHQKQAVDDENTFRAQVGLPLRWWGPPAGGTGPAEDSTPFPRCKPVYPGWSPDCIVATAAAGSPFAPSVRALRRAKRDYRALSGWVSLVAEPALDMYGRFSPLVVHEIESDPALGEAMLLYAVQPAVHLLEIVELYVAAATDDAILLQRVDESARAYLAEVVEANGFTATLGEMADAATEASLTLRSGRLSKPLARRGRRMPDDLFRYLASAVAESGRDTAPFAWAIEGMAWFLGRAAGRSRGDLSQLGEWLSRLPLPAEADLKLSDAADELRTLADRFFTRPSTRGLFAERLLARWPDSTAPALESLLHELCYSDPRRGPDRR